MDIGRKAGWQPQCHLNRVVFRDKQDEDGIVVCNKARLVAQGYTQVEGMHYGETYAPVARLESIRILLAYAYHHDITLYQMDNKSAFLNGEIEEEFMINNLLALLIVRNSTMFTNPTKLFMVLNKLLELGINAWLSFFLKKGLKLVKLILHSLLKGLMENYLCAKFMLII